MKRVRNSSCHAAMLRRELVERLDCLGVTQDDGYLPALGAQRGLPLGARLGGCHGSGGQQTANSGGDFRGQPIILFRHTGSVFGGVAADLAGTRGGGLGGDLAHVIGAATVAGFHNFRLDAGACEGDELGGDLIGGHVLHLYLRVGPIPTMCLSYSVTSDVSTTVRREAA